MNIFKKIFNYIKGKFFFILNIIQIKRREKYLKKERERLENKSFTLIANNCNGCVLSHELGVRFNSQFVNLSINAADYITYLKKFDYYNSLDLVFIQDETKGYPVAKLESITINFIHYKSEEEARLKWEERKSRIDKENIYIIFTEQDGCTQYELEEFDKLPFKNKVVFTQRQYSDIESAIHVKKYENNPLGVHMFLDFKNRFSAQRNYDVFDFVSWFNGETDLNKLKKDVR